MYLFRFRFYDGKTLASSAAFVRCTLGLFFSSCKSVLSKNWGVTHENLKDSISVQKVKNATTANNKSLITTIRASHKNHALLKLLIDRYGFFGVNTDVFFYIGLSRQPIKANISLSLSLSFPPNSFY